MNKYNEYYLQEPVMNIISGSKNFNRILSILNRFVQSVCIWDLQEHVTRWISVTTTRKVYLWHYMVNMDEFHVF